MAKIYSFPEGQLIEDTGNPIDHEKQLLESVTSNPEGAVAQILGLSQSHAMATETLQKIFTYVTQYDEIWSKQILSIIQSNYKVSGGTDE